MPGISGSVLSDPVHSAQDRFHLIRVLVLVRLLKQMIYCKYEPSLSRRWVFSRTTWQKERISRRFLNESENLLDGDDWRDFCPFPSFHLFLALPVFLPPDRSVRLLECGPCSGPESGTLSWSCRGDDQLRSTNRFCNWSVLGSGSVVWTWIRSSGTFSWSSFWG